MFCGNPTLLHPVGSITCGVCSVIHRSTKTIFVCVMHAYLPHIKYKTHV